MRPDTEPNEHAQRIMAGAAVLTAGLLFSHLAFWTIANAPTVALGIAVLSMATGVCYVLGTVALDVWGYVA